MLKDNYNDGTTGLSFFYFFYFFHFFSLNMGNNQSDIKNPFVSKNIPKHLKPLKKKKKYKFKKPDSTCSKKEKTPVTAAETAATKATPLPPPILLLNSNNNDDSLHLAGEETDFVGSGPRGAFRWFKGRRYLNYAEEVYCFK